MVVQSYFNMLFYFLLILLLQIHLFLGRPVLANNSYTTAGLPREELQDPNWNYINFSTWPELCRTGTQQSPISFSELTPKQVIYRKDIKALQFSPRCTFAAKQNSLKVQNEVSTISVRIILLSDPQGKNPSPCTTHDPTDPNSPLFHFVSMHFHSPAEHIFPHAKPDAELHMVFANTMKTGEIQRMVIAVQLIASKKINTTSVHTLRRILVEGTLPPKHVTSTSTLDKEMELSELLPRRKSFLAYNGSLTTPPCTEGIRFIVMTSPQIISKLALDRLVEAFEKARPGDHNGNHRPTQPLNGRVVFRYVDMNYNKTTKSKGEVKDYYMDDTSSEDVWGHEDEVLNASSIEEVPKDINPSEDNSTQILQNNNKNNKKWPIPLKTPKAILFASSALLLLIVTIFFYRRSNDSTTAGISPEEVEALSGVVRDYGTAPI